MNKNLWLIRAPQFAIIGFIFFNILAMLTYPGGTLHDSSTIGYSFFNNFLSDLGRFITWNGSHNFYSQLFFNSVMIITGIIFSLYFIALQSIFNLTNGLLYWLSIIGTIAGIAGGYSMVGIGLTPADLYFPSHLLFAHWLFRFFFIAAACYTIIIFKTDFIDNKYVSGFFIFAILILSYIIFSEFGPNAKLNTFTLMMQVAAQKLILLCFLIAIYINTKGLESIINE